MASFEKPVVDIEILQMMSEFLTPIRVDDAELGLEAIAEVGPGGHFFASPHTLARYETAFYSPLVSNWQNHESWEMAESVTAEQRAAGIVRRVLTDLVERRRREGGAAAA